MELTQIDVAPSLISIDASAESVVYVFEDANSVGTVYTAFDYKNDGVVDNIFVATRNQDHGLENEKTIFMDFGQSGFSLTTSEEQAINKIRTSIINIYRPDLSLLSQKVVRLIEHQQQNGSICPSNGFINNELEFHYDVILQRESLASGVRLYLDPQNTSQTTVIFRASFGDYYQQYTENCQNIIDEIEENRSEEESVSVAASKP